MPDENAEKKKCDCIGMLQTVDKYTVAEIRRCLLCSNVCNAAFLITVTVTYFLTLSFVKAPTAMFLGIYLGCFGTSICLFELSSYFRSLDFGCALWYWKNCGFMFHWAGRLAFLLFVATVALGCGTFGIVVACLTFLNILLNLWILTKHKEYKVYLEEQNTDNLFKAKSKAQSIRETDDEGEAKSALTEWGEKAQQVKKGMEFAQENREDIEKGQKFYKEHQKEVDAVVEWGEKNPKVAKKIADAL